MAIQLQRPENLSSRTPLRKKGPGAHLYTHQEIQKFSARMFHNRYSKTAAKKNLRVIVRLKGSSPTALPGIERLPEARYAAFGWQRDDVETLSTQGKSGKEAVGSTGYDGPLAILAQGMRNLSDYFKERVAVVTNPAIDRVREGAHFSTHTFLGGKPRLYKAKPHKNKGKRKQHAMPPQILLRIPVLADTGETSGQSLMRHVARQFGTLSLNDLLNQEGINYDIPFDGLTSSSISLNNGKPAGEPQPEMTSVSEMLTSKEAAAYSSTSEESAAVLQQRTQHKVKGNIATASMTLPYATTIATTFPEGTPIQYALRSICQQAETIVHDYKSSTLVLDDRDAFSPGHEFILDGALAVAALNSHLATLQDKKGISLRRRTSIVLCSGMLRNVHDIMVALGLGAEAVVPYLMFRRLMNVKGDTSPSIAVINLLASLQSGIEKVMSTMGIHELNGYGKLFASIGFTNDLTNLFHTKNELGSVDKGKSLADVEQDMRTRLDIKKKELTRTPVESHLYPKVWKIAGDVAQSKAAFTTFTDRLNKAEEKSPVSLRHTWDLQPGSEPVTAQKVDLRTDGLDAPIYISAMSFGSQGEIAYRAYAESMARTNLCCMNGEGGELDDLIGKYYHNRGQQVASGRFGVNARMLNSARYLEIKIGQGAKPGEGGQLPGFKVTPQIAEARHTEPNIELISPSNNHDIYSIEDLAQIIEELKTINPEAKVSIKVPAIPYLGLIATGIAKAGADIITISGYTGGTGAARMHALKYVGYPVEISVRQTHLALLDAGLRSDVEIWADGGMKSADDV